MLGKPLGLVAASAIAVQAGFAEKAGAYSWRQLAGAGALAGIVFTMSLFIAGQAFPDENAFAAAKMAILSASVLAGLVGTLIFWSARTPQAEDCDE